MTTPQTITSEIQKLEPSALIELYQLDLTPYGGSVLYFHAGTNGLRANVVWQGHSYSPFPIEITGFEITSSGQPPRPTMHVSNVLGTITALVLQYQDLRLAKVTRLRTLIKYLDAVNFTGGVNASADPTAGYENDVFYIDQKTQETRDVVTFVLTSGMDLQGLQLPRRLVIQNICPWVYRGAECGYTGTSYFDASDASVGTLALDVCAKHLSSCKLRFGAHAQLPYGGFPAAGLQNS